MNYKIAELIDVAELQTLLDSFYDATGVPSSIIETDGEIVTATGWADICTKFHRVNPLTCKRCIESDTELALQLENGEKYNMYKCKNGLVDIAVPIIVEGMHIANLFTGQLLLEAPNTEFFKAQAKEFGFDEALYLEALGKVKIFSESQIRQRMDFLTKLSSMIANMGLAKKNQLDINEKVLSLLEIKVELNQELTIEKEKLEVKTEELQKSNKELDDFAYISSHDLREPLRGISNYSKFLIEDYEDKLDEEGKNMLLTISKLSDRLEQFIDSLLFYSRLGRTSVVRENVSIKDIIDEVMDSLDFAIKEKPTIVTILEGQPDITCDKLRTTEIYRNLIANALKYNDKPERCIEIGYKYEKTTSKTPILYIRDNGIGIDEKYFDKVFTIFKRLHPRDKFGGGTGAGLTIAKKCVELHHGEIWVESKLDEGTTFYFTLPEEQPKNKENY